MEKLIIEVGSTVTKLDKYDGQSLERIKDKTIFFKKHYHESQELFQDDLKLLYELIYEAKKISTDIYVCGTSIFRNLNDSEKEKFLSEFKEHTGLDFHIISAKEENELTVVGATRFIKGKVGIMIGGGGSTEIAIYDHTILESANTSIGVMDVLKEFPDLSQNFATTDLEEVKKYILERLNLPKEKADILILAGGAHKKFAIDANIKYEKNTLYEDNNAPIMMDINSRQEETIRYFKEISLDEIREKSSDPSWWDATRAMCAFALVVTEAIGAKYIVPTDISMSYGIIAKLEQ